MVNPDITLLYQFVIFLLLLVLLSKLLFKPLLDMYDRRERLISDPAEKAEQLGDENKQISAEYQQKLAAGLEKAEEIKAAKLQEAAEKEKEILLAAREENEKFLTGMREEMTGAREGALEELKGQVERYSAEIAQTILGRAIS